MIFTNRIKGKYKLEAVKKNASGVIISKRKLTDWFDNLITNAGLNLHATTNCVASVSIGTGSSIPSVSDTSLAAAANSVTLDSVESYKLQESPYYAYSRYYFEFPTGINNAFTEVGIFSSGGTMFSRSLIEDAVGDPTIINVLSDEILVIYYELQVYQDFVQSSGSVDFTGIHGGTYSYLLKPAYASLSVGDSGDCITVANNLTIHQFETVLGSVTDGPVGEECSVTGVDYSYSSYVNNSFYREVSIRIPVDAGNSNNSTGIHAIGFTVGFHSWQMLFTPYIPKTNVDVVTLIFAVTWRRY